MDREGWMYLISSPEAVSAVHEQIDIEDGEYSGWDADGYPISLIWDVNTGPRVKMSEGIASLDDLRSAIFRYAKLGKLDTTFINGLQDSDVIKLFMKVDQQIDEAYPHLIERIMRFLRHQ